MKLDQDAKAAKAEGISGTGWLCSARHPKRMLPDNTHFMEKNVGWVLACHTQKRIALQKNVLSKGLIRAFMGPLPCIHFLKKLLNLLLWTSTVKSVPLDCRSGMLLM